MNIIKGSIPEKWAEVQASQHSPFVYINSGESVEAVLDTLSLYQLSWEYGAGVTRNPCTGIVNPKWSFASDASVPHWIDGPRIFDAEVTKFSGNFVDYSAVFDIWTNDPGTIEALTAAINANFERSYAA